MGWLSDQILKRRATRARESVKKSATASGTFQVRQLGGGTTGDEVADRLASSVMGGVALVIGFRHVAAEALPSIKQGELVKHADGTGAAAGEDPVGVSLIEGFVTGMDDPIRVHCAVRVGAWIYFADSLARHGEHGWRRRLQQADDLFGVERPAERIIRDLDPPELEASPINDGNAEFIAAAGQAMIMAATDELPPASVIKAGPFEPLWSYAVQGSRDYVKLGREGLIYESNINR